MVRDEELRQTLSDAAKAMAEHDRNPSTWLSWVLYFLKELQDQATGPDPMYQDLFREMLSYLQETLHNRLKTGGW